ncbi:MAG TPA: sigma-70 family RNA polymerase sigma factor [Puia sp.]|jgi:RNA polymerase sigma-70 factor (ECF subfamily)|nr:sigma-70 family RNA polymerase sigma factor [Puia sp.]
MMRKNNPSDDAELFSRFQRGDPAAFRTFYERHHQKMRLNIYAFVGRMDIAKDIVAETFAKLFLNRAKVKDASHISGYLFVIAKRLAIGYLRLQKRQRETDDAQKQLVERSYTNPAEAEAEMEQVINKILGLVRQLPPAMKRIFRMYFFEGMDIRTIAKQLHLTETAVRNQKNLALGRLRKMLT